MDILWLCVYHSVVSMMTRLGRQKSTHINSVLPLAKPENVEQSIINTQGRVLRLWSIVVSHPPVCPFLLSFSLFPLMFNVPRLLSPLIQLHIHFTKRWLTICFMTGSVLGTEITAVGKPGSLLNIMLWTGSEGHHLPGHHASFSWTQLHVEKGAQIALGILYVYPSLWTVEIPSYSLKEHVLLVQCNQMLLSNPMLCQLASTGEKQEDVTSQSWRVHCKGWSWNSNPLAPWC